jgi:hypothetical protein
MDRAAFCLNKGGHSSITKRHRSPEDHDMNLHRREDVVSRIQFFICLRTRLAANLFDK